MGRWHAHALRTAGVPLAAVVDPDATRAGRLAARHRGATVFRDLTSLLDRGAVDVVHVCTPLETHGALVREAVDAGVHAIVEKPLTATAAEAEELFRRARSRGVLLCPVHQVPFQTGVARLQRRLPRLGSILHLDATLCSAGGEGRSGAERSEIAADILPHPLSLFARLLPTRVDSLEWHAWQPSPGELRAHGAAGGVSFSIVASMRGRPTLNSLRVVGDRGTAHLDLFHGYGVIEPGGVSRARKIWRPFALSGATLVAAAANLALRAARREPAYPGLAELVRRFYLAVEGRADPPIGEDEALGVARARDELIRRLRAPGEVGVGG